MLFGTIELVAIAASVLLAETLLTSRSHTWAFSILILSVANAASSKVGLCGPTKAAKPAVPEFALSRTCPMAYKKTVPGGTQVLLSGAYCPVVPPTLLKIVTS